MKRTFDEWWSAAAPGTGEPAVLKEMAKFPPKARASIRAVMERYQRGETTPKEASGWDHGLLELRKKVDRAWFRVIFDIDGRKLVALVAFQKKDNRTPKKASDRARARKSHERVQLDLDEITRD